MTGQVRREASREVTELVSECVGTTTGTRTMDEDKLAHVLVFQSSFVASPAPAVSALSFAQTIRSSRTAAVVSLPKPQFNACNHALASNYAGIADDSIDSPASRRNFPALPARQPWVRAQL